MGRWWPPLTSRACSSSWASPTRTPRTRPPGWPPSCGDCASWTARSPARILAAPLLVVSQFTLYADTRKGGRPTWLAAAPGPVAEPLVDAVAASLRALGAHVETGVFGADMKVSLVNDGPVTILIEV